MVNKEIVVLPETDQVWLWLTDVSDPEIPVISVVDLGIVRNVSLRMTAAGTACTVVITPTYSGCPAMKVIAQTITETLQAHGIAHVEIETQLSPAWTTDWMSEYGKSQLSGYGIAPPAQQVIDISGISRKHRLQAEVPCPRCHSMNTVCLSEFGSTSCKSLYQCKDCLEPFDYFKAH
ncbi:1,2-phenylacetyl-CoA epoxidase subunit PaaD [Herbaspirillum sp. RTI4]|uniref:1,2-phenylacetyl-CoA epoxidase subunit PaaD n=1 Tax=Herbaspirillum sp. RTI4 TaxID=3048640 RepID=UPI002AB3CE56|nr:1,2-phenylacetyl-CoA epoxidase subunit PaaD [Herbaspirillum sp. RTI4]MDY7578121.1 1,2-phenylacetyl-CoA epoxidase subunit PaaD [Herbaspirillum sp. RTI4]MEA9980710.1 phenylacetate-CoA oxygenase subunit PaaJ [Herbaspirillum sp. RTI4]